jgi:16S rRNA (adenine1518-N6/adenine1519-N6)-dimethyltransferase
MVGGAADLAPLRQVIARHGIGARRSLGQHFLLDLNLTQRIARAAGELAHVTVIEIGPGPGGLTRALLAAGAGRIFAIERDERCAGALGELADAYPGRLEVIMADALTVAAGRLGTAPRRIVANLPYNVATPLLLGWLADIAAFDRLILMFQKEVALRLTAAPGSRDYGRLSVIAQWLTEPKRLFDIPPQAFTPPPKVTSSVVELKPRPAPLAADRRTLERVTAAAFGQRRKMLRHSLRALGGDPAALLEAVGIAGTARAEELTIAQFCALAAALDARSPMPASSA